MTESVATFLTDWTHAEQAGDTAALDNLLTDDFTAVGPLGFILPKPAWLARHRDGDLRYTSFTVDEPAVRRLGPVAVVTATNHQQATYQGNPAPGGQFRVTHIMIRRDGGWLVAGFQVSPISAPAGR